MKNASEQCAADTWPALQVTIQLKRFAVAVKKVKDAVGSEKKVPRKAAGVLGETGVTVDKQLAEMLRTDVSGIDPSVGGAICVCSSCLSSL